MCFHAQQCVEKALKALLLAYTINVPRTHNIAVLLDLLKSVDVQVPDLVDESFVLTQYAVATRYPGVWDPVDEEEARTALGTAAHVLDWATAQIATLAQR